MKLLILNLSLLFLLSGCKGLLAPYSVKNLKPGKICNLVAYNVPDLVINFDLIDNNYDSLQIELNNEKLMNECTDINQVCSGPYFTVDKSQANELKIVIHDSKYQKFEDLNVKLSLISDDSSTRVIESQNEKLNWTEKYYPNCSTYRSAELTINE